MSDQQRPSKESVRAWLRARGQSGQAPPEPADIRRQLGWERQTPAHADAGAPRQAADSAGAAGIAATRCARAGRPGRS